jgi:hypothetical protein
MAYPLQPLGGLGLVYSGYWTWRRRRPLASSRVASGMVSSAPVELGPWRWRMSSWGRRRAWAATKAALVVMRCHALQTAREAEQDLGGHVVVYIS